MRDAGPVQPVKTQAKAQAPLKRAWVGFGWIFISIAHLT